MDTPGKYIKRERELRNLSLKEVSRATRIKEHYLWAIEEDRYDLLPSPVYVKGYLTTYARYLGIDPKEVIQIYQNYLKTLNLSPGPEIKKEVFKNRRRLIFILLISFALVIFFLALLLWNLTKVSSPSYESLQPSSSEVPSEPIAPRQEREDGHDKKPIEKTDIKKSLPEVIEACMASGIGVEDRRLVPGGKSSEFICNHQRVYCFTRIRTDQEIKVSHVWFLKDKEFQKIEMDVKPPVWSIYSYLTLRPNLSGPWRVEVRWENEILKSLNFNAIEAH